MRHPKVDRLEELLEAAADLLDEADSILNAEGFEEFIKPLKYTDDSEVELGGPDYPLADFRQDLRKAKEFLETPIHQFTEVYWKSYKRKLVEDLASAY